MVDYKAIRDELKTGDLVFFSGAGLVSGLIKLFTKSQWTHVGMVVRIPYIDSVLLWESTSLSKSKDVISGRLVSGVQISALSDRAAEYNNNIGVRHLSRELNETQLQTLAELRHEFNGREYEQSKLDLAFSALDFAELSKSEDLSSLFCSEMVAEALKRMKVLITEMPSDEFTPADLSRLKL